VEEIKMDIRPIDGNALKEDFCSMPPFEIDRHDVLEMINDQEILSLNTLRDTIYEDAVAHGLWEDYDQTLKRNAEFCAKYTNYAFDLDAESRNECALCVCRECVELREARDDADAFTEELADVIIMSMSVAGKLGIDIDAAIRRKMEINKNRPWKHGKE
jgi:NTP pyrophosphatase (non-canonical NTP hydrolase)